MPLYTQANGYWQNVSWVNGGKKTEINVNPPGELSFSAEIGVDITKRITLGLSYRELKWGRSKDDDLGGGATAFQPKIIQRFLGLWTEIHF